MIDPFGGTARPSGASDNATPTSLATVTRRSLSSQTQVNATLGYAEAGHVRVPMGAPPSAVSQAEQAVSNSEGMLQGARESLASDSATLANAEATTSASRGKEAVDCAGDNAAEEAPGASPPSGEAASSGSPSSNAAASVCAGDVQALASDEQQSGAAAMKVKSDRASLSSAEAALSERRALRVDGALRGGRLRRGLDVLGAARGRHRDRAGTEPVRPQRPPHRAVLRVDRPVAGVRGGHVAGQGRRGPEREPGGARL